jgi:hypothetical protein
LIEAKLRPVSIPLALASGASAGIVRVRKAPEMTDFPGNG